MRQFDTSSIAEYIVVLAALLVALGLAIDTSTSEEFADASTVPTTSPTAAEDASATAAIASIGSAFDRIASIPGAAKKYIIDGVDSMAAALRPKDDAKKKTPKQGEKEGETGKEEEDKENVDMNPALYEKDMSLWGKDRKVDPEKYKKMTTRYANIHFMMCNLKSVDKDVHDKILATLLPSKNILAPRKDVQSDAQKNVDQNTDGGDQNIAD
jgi:hypothetical protein